MARIKQQDKQTLKDFQALHLDAAEWFDKRHHHFAIYVFLEKGFRQLGVTTDNACESSNNSILSDRHLAISDFCCEVNAYINQQSASRIAKWLCSMKKLSDFEL
jgi:hypothetical protein